MGLAERLAARASAREATAQVDCGELGSVTVEALPVRELELLLREPDGQRVTRRCPPGMAVNFLLPPRASGS